MPPSPSSWRPSRGSSASAVRRPRWAVMPTARAWMTVARGLAPVLLMARSAAGQELEPRAYSPSPSGTTFVVVTATRSAGGVFTDPSTPLTDGEAEVGILGLGTGHVFALMGRSALVMGLVPVTWGAAAGSIGEDRYEANRRGPADPRI